MTESRVSTTYHKGVIPLLRETILHNSVMPLEEVLESLEMEDEAKINKIYDDAFAPLIEEVAFALVPVILFPDTIVPFLLFRTIFLLLHFLEKSPMGGYRLQTPSLHHHAIPILLSLLAVLTGDFVLSLFFHYIVNIVVTPVLARLTGIRFHKA